MVRNASGDGTVRVRLGNANCYCPRSHRVELDGDDLSSRERDEVLAVSAHEGAHARLSLYDRQLSHAVLDSPLELRAVNVLEDARIDAWVVHAFPGLSEGQARMHDRCFGPDPRIEELQLVPRCWRFVWALRAEAVGRPRVDDPDRLVEEAVRASLPATRQALDAWPREGFDDPPALAALSQRFCRGVEDVVLPAFRALLARDHAEDDTPEGQRRLEEVLARIAETDIDSTWANWTGGTPPEHVHTPPSWSGQLQELGALLGGFANRLERLLRPNALHSYVGGHASGPRIDLRRAMAWEASPAASPLGLFMRRVDPKEPVYRVAVVADLSGSMLGARLEAMANAVMLTTEACERLGLQVGVVVFGTRNDPDVEVLKELDEPLAHRRAALAEALIEKPPLGGETPLAQGLDRVRAVLGSPPDEGHDLVLVITDGYPRSSRVRFFAKPTRFSSTNDSGEQTGESLKSGRVSLWQTQEDETRDVARALEALEDPSRTVLGIGIGVDAPVDEFFEHAHAYADHEAFAEGFPALLESALSELFL